MIDVLTILRRLQHEREEQKIVPTHVEFARLINEVSKETRKELSRLCREGKIGTCRTLNGGAVFVKE